MSRYLSRILALALCCAMLCSVAPAMVFTPFAIRI